MKVANNPILEVSQDSVAFDSYRIDDASLLVRDDKICLYYKGRSIIHGKSGPHHTKMGVAFAYVPEGPFEKYPSAILDKSHEVLIWSEVGGVASLASINKTISIASEGLNFRVAKENLVHIPKAPGLYRPHLEDGHKVDTVPGWGVAMKVKKGDSHLIRYEMNGR